MSLRVTLKIESSSGVWVFSEQEPIHCFEEHSKSRSGHLMFLRSSSRSTRTLVFLQSDRKIVHQSFHTIPVLSQIELESRHLCSPAIVDKILSLPNLAHISHKEIHDRYYDTANFELTKNDFWLRLRGNVWEGKRPLSHDLNLKFAENRSRLIEQYREFSGKSLLAALSETGIVAFEGYTMDNLINRKNLFEFAEITSTRRKLAVDDFVIDIDHTNFGYDVLEIEVLVQNDTEIPRAKESLRLFQDDLGLSNQSRASGKVVEYLRRYRINHYEHLIEAGVVDKEEE